VYDPPKIRLDGSAERTATGATWSETYTRVVTDAVGIELSRIDITEECSIVGTGVACTTPWGEQQCLHVRRVRTVGGISDKEYFFARGYGKVLETGGQTEELLGCALH